LLEVLRPDDVLAGIRTALERGVIGFDAASSSRSSSADTSAAR
jgi:hypothetical protein